MLMSHLCHVSWASDDAAVVGGLELLIASSMITKATTTTASEATNGRLSLFGNAFRPERWESLLL
jgi:hypothetical protein